MSDSEKVNEPFDVAESNESYSEAQGEKEMEADLPILIEDSDEEGEAMELGEIKDDVKLSQEVPLDHSSPGGSLTVTLPRSAVDLAKKISSLSEASLQRIGDFLPFLENEKNAQIGRDGLKAELDRLQKESQQYAEHISSQKRILQKYVLEEKEISEKRENLEECGEIMAELHEQEESQMLQVEASMRRQMEHHSGVFQSALSGIPQVYLAEGIELTTGDLQVWTVGETKVFLGSVEAMQEYWMEDAKFAATQRRNKQSIINLLKQLKTPENLATAKRPRTNEESSVVEDSQALDALSKRVKTKGSVPLQVTSASVKREVKQGAFGFDMEEKLLDLLNPWYCYHPFRGSLFEPEDLIGYKRNVFKHFGLDIQKLDKDSKHFLPVPGCVVQDYTYGSPQNRHQGAKLKNSGKGPCVLLLGTSLTVPWRLSEGRNTFCDNIRPEKATTRAVFDFKHLLAGRGIELYQLHAAAICFGLEWTQCLNKTWGAFACAGSCPYWLDSGKTAPGIPPGLPHHHSTDHGPKECFGNGPFHINPAVIGSGGDPFRQMDKFLSQKMFLEVFSADFLCSDPKRAVSGRFIVGSSV
ncbi:unnamed protein product [Notodromas monacha]|uniref:Uncharacterized protein n=1 Tax=Notodromas monacha TaxID=399045 RepID=A0A7R9C1B9_9CRUS|nr:unnamed protein product [Notodromas monacha]CAG0924309.1 unnamed protein product [Notodromas monacha]